MGLCKTRLLAHSTAVIIMVVHVEIVGMCPWSWVLRLLLLLRGFMASVTFVAKLATCVVIALRLRARASRSRQKRLRPAPSVKHTHFVEHRVQAEACGCAFEAC